MRDYPEHDLPVFLIELPDMRTMNVRHVRLESMIKMATLKIVHTAQAMIEPRWFQEERG
jgi:hypothetical protein